MAERVNPTLPQGRALALAAACVLSAFFLAILGQVILGTAMPARLATLTVCTLDSTVGLAGKAPVAESGQPCR